MVDTNFDTNGEWKIKKTKKEEEQDRRSDIIKKEIEKCLNDVNILVDHYINVSVSLSKTVLEDDEIKERISDLKFNFFNFIEYNLYNDLVYLVNLFRENRLDINFNNIPNLHPKNES